MTLQEKVNTFSMGDCILGIRTLTLRMEQRAQEIHEVDAEDTKKLKNLLYDDKLDDDLRHMLFHRLEELKHV